MDTYYPNSAWLCLAQGRFRAVASLTKSQHGIPTWEQAIETILARSAETVRFMNDDAVEKIANAVLYEGYMLYPYRPSAVKNQQRFNFGVLYPREYCEPQAGSDNWEMQTECLVRWETTASIPRSEGSFPANDRAQMDFQEGVEREFASRCGSLRSQRNRCGSAFRFRRRPKGRDWN